jgi:type IV secretory pathway VirJ component
MSRAVGCPRTPGIRVVALSGLLALCWAALPRAAVAADSQAERHLPAGRFGTVTVYIPEGAPRSVAIFISGDGGWKLGVTRMAQAL